MTNRITRDCFCKPANKPYCDLNSNDTICETIADLEPANFTLALYSHTCNTSSHNSDELTPALSLEEMKAEALNLSGNDSHWYGGAVYANYPGHGSDVIYYATDDGVVDDFTAAAADYLEATT